MPETGNAGLSTNGRDASLTKQSFGTGTLNGINTSSKCSSSPNTKVRKRSASGLVIHHLYTIDTRELWHSNSRYDQLWNPAKHGGRAASGADYSITNIIIIKYVIILYGVEEQLGATITGPDKNKVKTKIRIKCETQEIFRYSIRLIQISSAGMVCGHSVLHTSRTGLTPE